MSLFTQVSDGYLTCARYRPCAGAIAGVRAMSRASSRAFTAAPTANHMELNSLLLRQHHATCLTSIRPTPHRQCMHDKILTMPRYVLCNMQWYTTAEQAGQRNLPSSTDLAPEPTAFSVPTSSLTCNTTRHQNSKAQPATEHVAEHGRKTSRNQHQGPGKPHRDCSTYCCMHSDATNSNWSA